MRMRRRSGGKEDGVGRDDDDWVGEPPEGRHTRDRARPGFWQGQWQATVARAVLALVVLLAVLLIVLS